MEENTRLRAYDKSPTVNHEEALLPKQNPREQKDNFFIFA
jgi:hypothetical protein